MNDSFISYATEDNDFAANIAYGLRANGLSTWFAPLSLKVGDKLLDSIEKGLSESRCGILLITRPYLEKKWTAYEMDILVRQHVEGDKKILPIWHGVTKKDVESRHLGLGGIVAITDTSSVQEVVSQLVQVLSFNAKSRGVIPIWEEPAYRFLQGLGEINMQTSNGRVTTIFEFLIHRDEHSYPFWLAGKSYEKEDLLYIVSQYLAVDPTRAKNWVGEDGYKKIWDMCIENGFNPGLYG
ncbi:toll/interleukin-1 receptor domain-containing protein [Vibrio cholerae]|nr:toll/interleukin-1 receptor domain-containing protein [Vibrio cholerae]EKG0043062.1 toll/interleukin-1 receptor domain-containing protein [Vibrio cholerae]ELR6565901.1 toll/interleukin-1 receptor domain-containing protein [Vibrio cholerae]